MNFNMLGDFLPTLIGRLSQTNVIVGIGLAIIGIALAALATRIAKAVKKTDEVDPNSKMILGIKGLGLVMILVAMVVMVIS